MKKQKTHDVSNVFENEDKSRWQEEIIDDGGIRRGSRCILTAPPNCGKTTKLLDMIIKTSRPFEKILIYRDSASKEYDSIVHDRVDSIAGIKDEDLCLDKKTLLILEDMDVVNNSELKVLDRLFRVVCSHYGLTIVVCVQNWFSFPPKLRRRADCIIIFPNMNQLQLILQQTPLDKDARNEIMNHERKAVIGNGLNPNHLFKHRTVKIDFAIGNGIIFSY